VCPREDREAEADIVVLLATAAGAGDETFDAADSFPDNTEVGEEEEEEEDPTKDD
jgi:hypothetical protein